MKRLDHRVVLCPSANFSRLTFATGGEQATVARCLHETAFIIPTPMETGLKNRVAIVAASSQGIGRATAEGFAAEGCRVAMCARNRATLEQAANKIREQYNTEVFAEPVDVTGRRGAPLRSCDSREIRQSRYLRHQCGRTSS